MIETLTPYIPHLALLLLAMGIIDTIWIWVRRHRANRQADAFAALFERAVAADEKHNEVGEKLAEVGEKLIDRRPAPPAEAPKFLH